MEQRELVLKSVKRMLSTYDARLESLKQSPIPLDVRIRETKKISQTIVAGVRRINKRIQMQEDTQDGTIR